MPGFQESEIRVACDGRTLFIAARRAAYPGAFHGAGRRPPFFAPRISRRILLPQDVDGSRVTFRCNGRLLTVYAPLLEQAVPWEEGMGSLLRVAWASLRGRFRRAWAALLGG